MPAVADLTSPTLFLGSEDVERVFSWKDAIAALKAAYGETIGDAMFPPRTMARGDGLWLRTLSGVAPDGSVMGAKLIAANHRQGRASYVIPLFDQSTVELVALIDGNLITGYRTAATTALAVDALTRPGRIDVGVLGTGFEARNHLQALAATRDIGTVKVFSPRAESRSSFVRDMSASGFDIADFDSAQAVVEAAPDVLLCAARSRGEVPLFQGEWLSHGMTIASIGSTLPEQREVDPLTISRASLIVADMPAEVGEDTGDMRAAKQAGVEFHGKLIALADLIGGRRAGRQADDEILLYKSVGAALQDISVAAMCLARAKALGIGTPLSQTIRPVLK